MEYEAGAGGTGGGGGTGGCAAACTAANPEESNAFRRLSTSVPKESMAAERSGGGVCWGSGGAAGTAGNGGSEGNWGSGGFGSDMARMI